jgi:tungstate transport system ATP-binding protein
MNKAVPVFEARDLQVIRGGSLILNIPSLEVAEGEIFCLIGPNGAGKSTLLQTLSALTRPSRGEIFFRGGKIGSDIPLLEHRRRLAMVLQEPLLFDTTVFNNVASGLKIRGMKGHEIGTIVGKVLERFGVANLKDRSARTLSGGEARRVSIARAFATSPEVLLLDEPFSALDPIIREALIEDLEQVLKETRITTIFVTHDRTEAFRLATRVGVMKAGEILQTGSSDDVMNHPASEFVASLVGVETILHGEVIKRLDGVFVVSVSGHDLQVAGDLNFGQRVVLFLRPENVILSNRGAVNVTGSTNAFVGKVERITPMGLYHKVKLNCGFPLVAYLTNHSFSTLHLKEKGEVLASFAPTSVHAIPEHRKE